MRSAGRCSDDLTARSRIRDTAVELIWRDGSGNLRVLVGDRYAGVSPGLIINHFRANSSLRAASEELQHRLAIPAMEVFSGGRYATPDIPDRYRNHLQRSGSDAYAGLSARPHRTEPNAPAGDPPSWENDEQGPPLQPAA